MHNDLGTGYVGQPPGRASRNTEEGSTTVNLSQVILDEDTLNTAYATRELERRFSALRGWSLRYVLGVYDQHCFNGLHSLPHSGGPVRCRLLVYRANQAGFSRKGFDVIFYGGLLQDTLCYLPWNSLKFEEIIAVAMAIQAEWEKLLEQFPHLRQEVERKHAEAEQFRKAFAITSL